MSFVDALTRGREALSRGREALTGTSERLRDQRRAEQLRQVTQAQEQAAEAAARRARADIAFVNQLAPDVATRDEIARQNEFQRSETERRGQTGDTVTVLNTALDGRERLQQGQFDGQGQLLAQQFDGTGSLIRTQGDVNLTAQESQQQAVERMLDKTQGQELRAMQMTYGDTALVPQILSEIGDARTQVLAHDERRNQMMMPTGFDKLLALTQTALAAYALSRKS
jgi:hypothetical protein